MSRVVDNRDLPSYVEYLEARIEVLTKRVRELEQQQGVIFQTVALSALEPSHIDD